MGFHLFHNQLTIAQHNHHTGFRPVKYSFIAEEGSVASSPWSPDPDCLPKLPPFSSLIFLNIRAIKPFRFAMKRLWQQQNHLLM
jgi:hypothetical protein